MRTYELWITTTGSCRGQRICKNDDDKDTHYLLLLLSI